MKTINLLIILLLTAAMAFPQHRLMQVHSAGEVAYEINTAQVDSVVFKNGESMEIPFISGMWKVKAISISGELTNIVSLPDNAHYPNISITIPDATQGTINGNTFCNTIWIDFEIKEHQQISFKNYGGTRSGEDDWGMAFRDHIMFNVVKFDISNYELQFSDLQNNPVIVFINRLNEN